MAMQGKSAKQPFMTWAKRLIGLVLVLGVAAFSAAFSLTQSVRLTNPEVARTIMANDPMALAAAADQIVVKNPTKPALWGDAETLATRSLRAQALNSRALRILSFAWQKKRPQTQLRALATLAIKTSRREAAASIWMIEDRVAQNDIDGALKHYDLALRTSIESRTLLNPLLTAAVEDEAIRTALVPYANRRPDWLLPFLEHAVSSGSNPDTIAKLVEESGGLSLSPRDQSLTAGLLMQLASKSQFSQMKRHYLSLKSAHPALLQSPEISADSFSDRHYGLSWQRPGSGSAGADFRPDGNQKGTVILYASSGERQLVARKFLFLKPGRYTAKITFGASQMASGATLDVSLLCLGQSALRQNPSFSLWQSGALSPAPNTAVQASIDVPASCAAETLDLAIAGGQSQQGAELVITSIALTPQANGLAQ
jgi:hypothetical protein